MKYKTNGNTFTLDEFIHKANIKHGDRYDYSNVKYENSTKKIDIFCKKHNIHFFQQANSHLRGIGCPTCGTESRSKSQAKTKERFVELAKEKHRDKYDYNEVVYVNYNTKVKIFCKEHNNYFYQFPDNHTRGYSGCSKCKGNSISKANRGTVEDFIIKAKAIHGGKYNYSEVQFINHHQKAKIFCNKHKEYFEQTITSHLFGNGCQKCSASKGENAISVFLDKSQIQYERQKKFETCRNVHRLPFDFYIPELNICIEFDGMQHSQVMGYWGGDKKLLDTQRKDKIKNNWCNENGVKLLRINYKDLPKIEEILTKLLLWEEA